jgi:protein-tyrosine phosphatase
MPPDALTADRHVALESVFNFRDLGGYAAADGRTVRWRVLYRADGLHRLSGSDLAAVGALGIATVLDLRTAGELEKRGRWPIDELPVDYRHLPLIQAIWDPATLPVEAPAEDFLTARYLEMLQEGGEAIATALGILAREDAYPAVFHCAAGKDRTGMLAAVVLSILGVSDDDIAADYGLSREGMTRMVAWIRANRPQGAEEMQNQPAAFLGAPPQAMRLVLETVRLEHGSVEGYVAGLGVGDDVITRVRANLLS